MSKLSILRGLWAVLAPRRILLSAIPLFALMAQAGCTGTGFAVGAAAVTGHSVLEERTTRNALTDVEIRLALNNAYLTHSGRLFTNVSTEVVEGRVLLTGAVPERQDRAKANCRPIL